MTFEQLQESLSLTKEVNMFNKLQWRDRPVELGGGRQGVYIFANGWEVSVVGGARGLYGNGRTSFEVAIFRPNGEMVGDVRGWLTPDEVSQLMEEVKSFTNEV